MSALDDHFLPGVSFTLDGETVPADKLSWAMIAACGCTCGVHMMTEDTMNETAAWKAIAGTVAMVKRDKARGFTIKMIRLADVNLDDCTHSPKWGYRPPPTPAGHSWAATHRTTTLHLVPLTEADGSDKAEWAEDKGDWSEKVKSLCGKQDESAQIWSRKWWRIDGKVECARCVKIAESQVLA